jgi:hypothetical protein
MGGDRTCPDDCPLARWQGLSSTDRKAQRKPIAEKLYKQGFTMEAIATQLSVSQATITGDLRNLLMTDKLKPTKTASNPKGAGRPKGSSKPRSGPQPARRTTTPAVEQTAAALVLDQGRTYEQTRAELGLRSVTVVKTAVAREEGRREPLIERRDLSMTAQRKLDAALRQQNAKLQAAFSATVDARVKQLLLDTILPRHRAEQEEAKRVMNARRGVMDKATFNKIRRCLHPDSRRSVSDKVLAEAFDAFMALEKRLLDEKDSPTTFSTLPQTDAEWEEAKRKATAARKAKRGTANAVHTC